VKKSIFFIDGGKNYYIGYTSGQTWNGWSMPYLSKSETMRMLENEDLDSIQFEWQGDELIETFDGDSLRTETTTIDGELYYQVGNGWVWDEVRISGEIAVIDCSGRGFTTKMSAIDYALNNIDECEAIEWLDSQPEFGDTIRLQSERLIQI
jgi:hypothetical protein